MKLDLQSKNIHLANIRDIDHVVLTTEKCIVCFKRKFRCTPISIIEIKNSDIKNYKEDEYVVLSYNCYCKNITGFQKQ